MRSALLVFLVSCGSAAAPSEPVTPAPRPTDAAVSTSSTDALDADVQRLLVLMEKLARVCEYNTANCPQMAAAWRAYGAEHKAEVEAIIGRIKAASENQRDAFREKYGAALEALIGRQNAAAMPCSQHSEVHEAAKALPSLD